MVMMTLATLTAQGKTGLKKNHSLFFSASCFLFEEF